MKTRAKIAFIEFLRPSGYWPHPYTIEQAFEVFRWMVTTGKDYERPTRWGYNGPIETLTCKPSCTNFEWPDPIASLEDLRRRFHFAILSNGHSTRGVDEWREVHAIQVDGERMITFRHHKPFSGGASWTCEADAKAALEHLFHEGRSRRLAISLNDIHPTAMTCKSVKVAVDSRGFRFMLEYGWPDEECTSRWFHELSSTKGNEPFLATMDRAISALGELTEKNHTRSVIDQLQPNAAIAAND